MHQEHMILLNLNFSCLAYSFGGDQSQVIASETRRSTSAIIMFIRQKGKASKSYFMINVGL